MIYFTHDELVPPELAKKGAEYCFSLFKPHFLAGLDKLREDLGFALYVNDWAIGGHRVNCGYRMRNCNVGAPYSMHKVGGAVDLHTATPDQMAALIARVRKFGGMYGIRRMENPDKTPGWCHVDCKEHGRPGLYVFDP